MGIVDRGSRGERHPRSQWPADRNWPPRSPPPEPQARPAPPIVTYLIIAACIAVFVYGEVTGERNRLNHQYGFVPMDFTRGETSAYIGLVTHMFLHGDWVHLLVNMVVLWSFGRGLEPTVGSARFVILFFVTGVAAAIAHGFLTDSTDVVLIGASGAIAGIVGAAAVSAPRLPVIFFVIPMPLYLAVIVLVAVHIAFIVGGWDPEIAWWAHLAGLAAGAVLFPLLGRRRAV